MALIELRNITKTYYLGEMDVPVLKGITLDIEKGGYVALMGASGSGKSTLMNILGCLDRQTGGDYFFEGEELGRASGDRRALIRNQKIGFVFQSFNLLPRTSALENVIMPLAYTAGDLSRKECKKRGIAALERVGLADRMGHYPSQLSGGQQQRVAIARALINHPPVLFADEPTGNLDSHTSEEVMQMFDELSAQGITVILVTHSMEIAGFARRVVRISDGEIKEDYYNRKEGNV
ncbi:MAG: ABC transporter ATP-binding protein [Lentisphaeria bacterium]|nr:ABC transporter ATP-binding protein [Lentisphaeria bacterium]